MSVLALAPAFLHFFTEVDACLKMEIDEHMVAPGPVFLKSGRQQITSALRLIVHSIPSSHRLGFFSFRPQSKKHVGEGLWYQLQTPASSLRLPLFCLLLHLS
jgi:hypothetical protein